MNLFKKLFPRTLTEAASAGNLSALQKHLQRRVPKVELDAAFLLAVKARSLEAAMLLHKHGANVNARDEGGKLHFTTHVSGQTRNTRP